MNSIAHGTTTSNSPHSTMNCNICNENYWLNWNWDFFNRLRLKSFLSIEWLSQSKTVSTYVSAHFCIE